MKNTDLTTNHIMVAPLQQSLAAARSVMKTENLVDLLVENQIQELAKIRTKYPTLPRLQAIKIALLNSAYKLKQNKYSESFCLAQVKKPKKTPQQDWLKQHKSFVIDLSNKQASTREIKFAIFYKFRHQISHVSISNFLNTEGVDYA